MGSFDSGMVGLKLDFRNFRAAEVAVNICLRDITYRVSTAIAGPLAKFLQS